MIDMSGEGNNSYNSQLSQEGIKIVSQSPYYKKMQDFNRQGSVRNIFEQIVNSYSFLNQNRTLERLEVLLVNPQYPHQYLNIVAMPTVGQDVYLIGNRKMGNQLLAMQRNKTEEGKELLNGGRLIDVFRKIMGLNILTSSDQRNKDYRHVFKP